MTGNNFWKGLFVLIKIIKRGELDNLSSRALARIRIVVRT